MDRWPHQPFAVRSVQSGIAQGVRSQLLTSPTGGGKTQISCDLIQEWLADSLLVSLYSNRKMLVEQTSRVLNTAGHAHGIRAAGHDTNLMMPLQVSSIQTEYSKVIKRGTWSDLHPADRVLIDEAHLQKSEMAREIIKRHLEAGAYIVGLTATPIDLGDLYDSLIVAGTTSELRACGALVPCIHYGPDEPDLVGIKAVEGEDLSENQIRKIMMTEGIFGRVLQWFDFLNPERKPTILFAPGVKESVWFAEQFVKAGVSAAHIDGEEIWINGEIYRTEQKLRDEVLARSQSGDIKVLCNRFVLREGIDAPWLAHGIFATVFGSLQSFLQSGGRLLRAHPSIRSVTLQDHGGNWWRHGSLNADREWNLAYTAPMHYGLRATRLREKKEREPFRCPECARILITQRCPCGYEVPAKVRSRPVIQRDGTLKEMRGDIFRPHRISQKPDGPKLWERMYYRSKTETGERTFRAAAALFARENNWGYPNPQWPLMPKNELDWFLKIKDVPRERLTK